jgi:CelD/BcsL family acetyltransferase involved in cellulose biosynthesis
MNDRSRMRVSCIMPADLPRDLRERWEIHQEGDPNLESPCFRPEFTEIMAGARSDAFVAVADDGAGFLPFHREAYNAGVARPIGANLSDFHGVICPPDYVFDPVKLVRGAGLAGWEFSRLPASQSAFAPFASNRLDSMRVDLALWPERATQLSKENQQRRKLAREIGPLELEWDCKDIEVFRQLMTWKSAQYVRTGMRDITKDAWAMQALTDINQRADPEFAGVLSVLRAGGQIVSINFSMSSRKVLQPWIPAYDPAFAKYRAGTTLWLCLLDEAVNRGFESAHFSTGDAYYKTRIGTSTVPVLAGVVTTNPWTAALRHARKTASSIVQKTPLRAPAAAFLSRVRRGK